MSVSHAERRRIGDAWVTTRPSLNVSLTPELVDYVGDRVRSGRYRSASEVVRAALRLLQREEPGSNGASQAQVGQPPRASTADG